MNEQIDWWSIDEQINIINLELNKVKEIGIELNNQLKLIIDG